MATLTVYSSDSIRVWCQDSTYSAARAGTGDLFNSGPALEIQLVGWNLVGSYSLDEEHFGFDTSSLDDDVIINDVAFSVYIIDTINTDNWGQLNLRLYDWGASINTGDFRPTNGTSAGDTLLGALARGDVPASGTVTWTNEAAFSGAINKTGTTKFYMVMSNSEAASAPTDDNQIRFYGGARAGTSQDPKLIINYTFPAIIISGITATFTTAALLPTITTVRNISIASEVANIDLESPLPTIVGEQVISIAGEVAEINLSTEIPDVFAEEEGIVKPPVAELDMTVPTPEHLHSANILSEAAGVDLEALIPIVEPETGVIISAVTATLELVAYGEEIITQAFRGIINAGQRISRILLTGGRRTL